MVDKKKPYIPYDDVLHEQLQDGEFAIEYAIAAAEDGNKDVFLLALRNIANARGGIGALAASSGLNRETLYRTLSENGNPNLDSLFAILDSLGLRISLTSKEKEVAES